MLERELRPFFTLSIKITNTTDADDGIWRPLPPQLGPGAELLVGILQN